MTSRNTSESVSWLTPRRLCAHATILALCLWLLYGWNMATPGLRDCHGNLKGTDFLHFYTLGSLAAAHRGADLYDMNAQAELAAQRVPEASGIRYLPFYPPQVSVFFAPLTRFSYGWALGLWWACSALLYGVCCYGIWRACPNLSEYGGTVFMAAIAFPAFFHLIAWGQTSALALVCFTLMFFLLRDRRDFLAGLILGCLIFKPQLGVAAVVVFLATGAWKVLAGATLSAAGQLSIAALYYGTEPLGQWWHMLRNAQAVLPLLEPRLYQTHCLRTFWSMLVPWPGLALALFGLSAIAVLTVTIACWKSQNVPLPLKYSVLLLASVLVAPHLTVYDLVILAPALLLLADWIASQPSARGARRLATLMYFVYMLPLVGPYTRWTHIQFSVVAMAAAVWSIWRISRELDPVTSVEGTMAATSAL